MSSCSSYATSSLHTWLSCKASVTHDSSRSRRTTLARIPWLAWRTNGTRRSRVACASSRSGGPDETWKTLLSRCAGRTAKARVSRRALETGVSVGTLESDGSGVAGASDLALIALGSLQTWLTNDSDLPGETRLSREPDVSRDALRSLNSRLTCSMSHALHN